MRKILFIDDEESILNTYRRIFHGTDIIAYFALDTKTAEEIMKNNDMNMIVSDYRLKQETGLEFIKKLRGRDIKIPMVILSGYAEEEFVKEALSLNVVQDFILKPISPLDLREKLNTYLDQE